MFTLPKRGGPDERKFGYYGIFLRMWSTKPVFHIPGGYVRDGGHSRAACGRPTANERGQMLGSWVPTRFAVKFGRPCRPCVRSLRKAQGR